jgi:hypothetical protein
MKSLRSVFFIIVTLISARSAFAEKPGWIDWCALTVALRAEIGQEMADVASPAAAGFLTNNPSRDSLRLFALATLDQAFEAGESTSIFHGFAFDHSKGAKDFAEEIKLNPTQTYEFLHPRFDELIAQSFLTLIEGLGVRSVSNRPGEWSAEDRISIGAELRNLKKRVEESSNRILFRSRFFGRLGRDRILPESAKDTPAALTHPRIEWNLIPSPDEHFQLFRLQDRATAQGVGWVYIYPTKERGVAFPMRLNELTNAYRRSVAAFDTSSISAFNPYRNIITLTASLRDLFRQLETRLDDLTREIASASDNSKDEKIRELMGTIQSLMKAPWETCLEFARTHGEGMLADRLEDAADRMQKAYAVSRNSEKSLPLLPVLQ